MMQEEQRLPFVLRTVGQGGVQVPHVLVSARPESRLVYKGRRFSLPHTLHSIRLHSFCLADFAQMITRKALQPERRKTSLSPNGYAGNGTGEEARRQRARHTETEVEKQSDNSSGEAPPSWPNKPCHISPNPPRYIYSFGTFNCNYNGVLARSGQLVPRRKDHTERRT